MVLYIFPNIPSCSHALCRGDVILVFSCHSYPRCPAVLAFVDLYARLDFLSSATNPVRAVWFTVMIHGA